MGKLQAFEIVFDHPWAVYTAGETIRGHVLVELEEAMKMRSELMYTICMLYQSL